MIPNLERFRTVTGAFGTKAADLFPTMAAVEVASTLGFKVADPQGIRRVVRARRGAEGGVGAQPGQPADAWSTAYAVEALAGSGAALPARLPAYLLLLHRDGGFAMATGQAPEVWATGFVMAALGRCGVPVPDPAASVAWLAGCTVATGGFGWSPEWAAAGRADVRATGFAIRALAGVGLLDAFAGEIDLEPTVRHLLAAQDASGAFALDHRHTACAWGLGEAIGALNRLDRAPEDPASALTFLREMRGPDGGYRRGPGFPEASDLWATMHAVRSCAALGEPLSADEAAETMAFVESCSVDGGGYTYRPPDEAPDVLATSGAVLAQGGASASALAFLEACRMPGEGGVAYMPARGAEARATLWTLVALRHAGRPVSDPRIAAWARSAQGPDGGFGPWEGRASAPVATQAALESIVLADHAPAEVIDLDAVRRWLLSAASERRIGDPGADLVELAALVRAAHLVDVDIDTRPLRAALATHRVDGGWRRHRQALPDLLATYVALTAHQDLGALEQALAGAAAWAALLPADADGTGWSPLSVGGDGPLPAALAALIAGAQSDGLTLPHLIL